jgi:prolipoprotein diacylglyceryl transferase
LFKAIPTPSSSALELGPLTIHFYALCIIAGVAVAIWLGDKRLRAAFPNTEHVVADVAIFAIPVGVIGGRLYHVATTPEKYFGASGSPADILKIWQGGLGIWGAIALGALGAYLAYRRLQSQRELPGFANFLDALAPGLLLAQAVGRWGNWFNGELFGRPLDAPWALSIPPSLRPAGFSAFETFHPTFLYESIWMASLALALISIGKRLPVGALFALYVAGYSLARFFIEGLRIDQAYTFNGLRLNQYVALLIFSASCAVLIGLRRAKR